MDDWKKKVDDRERRREEARQRAREEEERQRKLQEQREEERKKQEYQRKLNEHQQKFKCHVCGKTSNGPVVKWEPKLTGSWGELETGPGSSVTYWNEPTGLFKCECCNKWYCKQHIHRGICQRCSEKL